MAVHDGDPGWTGNNEGRKQEETMILGARGIVYSEKSAEDREFFGMCWGFPMLMWAETG